MNKIIIALWGRGNSGKTTTIGLVHDQLQGIVGAPILFVEGGVRRQGRRREFHAIFIVYERKVGIASAGDLRELIEPRLEEFEREECSVVVCACHTRGDTVEAVDEFARAGGWQLQYVEKQIGMNENLLNTADATIIVQRILNASQTSPQLP